VERSDPVGAAENDAAITEWVAGQPAHETFHRAQAMRVPVTIVASPTEVLASPQYEARGYWVDYDDADLGALRLPKAPFRLASDAFAPFGPAHHLGADTDAVLASIAEATA